MNHPPGDAVAPATPTPVRRPFLGAILTDVHFWIPVVVLGIGLVLLAFLS